MATRLLVVPLMLLSIVLSPLAVATAAAAPGDGKVKYPGAGFQVKRLSGDERRLDVPRSLKKFIRTRLDELFEEAGGTKRCATAPVVSVNRYHPKGFASVGEGIYGRCAAGGWQSIYVKRSGGWRDVLGTQDVRYCEDLRWWRVPRFVAGGRCIAEDGDLEKYRASGPAVSPESQTRRAVSLVAGYEVIDTEMLIESETLADLASVHSRAEFLEQTTCATRGDGSTLSDYLGGSAAGCELVASYNHGSDEHYVLRMSNTLVITEVYRVG